MVNPVNDKSGRALTRGHTIPCRRPSLFLTQFLFQKLPFCRIKHCVILYRL